MHASQYKGTTAKPFLTTAPFTADKAYFLPIKVKLANYYFGVRNVCFKETSYQREWYVSNRKMKWYCFLPVLQTLPSNKPPL